MNGQQINTIFDIAGISQQVEALLQRALEIQKEVEKEVHEATSEVLTIISKKESVEATAEEQSTLTTELLDAKKNLLQKETYLIHVWDQIRDINTSAKAFVVDSFRLR